VIPLPTAKLFTEAGVRWQRLPDGAAQRRVEAVSTDTREISAGALFVGLRGASFDGADFAADAVARGARAVLAEDGRRTRLALDLLATREGVAVGTVEDGRAALAAMARLVRSRVTAPVVAITGSVGKTTTKEALRTIARPAFPRVVASRASFNNDVGVPLSIFEAEASTGLLVLEVGTNAPGEIAGLAGIARPNVAVITRIGRSHLEGLGSLEGVAREKRALFESVAGAPGAACVLGFDTPLRELVLEAVPAGADLVTVSAAGDARASLRAVDVRADGAGAGTRFVLRGERAGDLDGAALRVPLLGAHAVENALVALGAVVAAGGAIERAAEGLEALQPAHRRLQPHVEGGVTVIDDAYNANPESFRAALAVLASRPARRVLVAGRMAELGPVAEEMHRALGESVQDARLDAVVLVDESGDDAAIDALAGGIGGAVPTARVASAAGAAAALGPGSELLGETGLRAGDTVLVKASRSARLERVVDALCEGLRARSGAADGAPIPARDARGVTP